MDAVYRGGCLCNQVAFEIKGGFDAFFLCHCGHCRKDTGSAHASNLFSSSAQLRWLKGEQNVQCYQVPDTRHVKSFCSHCGSALPTIQEEGAMLVVPAGSLDTPVSITPNAHIFVADKANWDEQLERVPRIDGAPV
ncbi:Gfa-like protein [Marinobacterium lacunae]|uniref:Gfa-like protein n=1 Tax=Marinobacterium lacunae TaxID=1232683 RepID=A0A081FYR5_9GAMM|nr:GFA family protein [Marinobacterium lacunae]KEA63670.1 Gfa-like protein [Marinobacterium lacunae]MBR9883824.1 GFA family protein [Oceanospirillales bacterium]